MNRLILERDIGDQFISVAIKEDARRVIGARRARTRSMESVELFHTNYFE